MEFFFAVFFLLFYNIRPHDWLPGLQGVELVKPIIACWVLSLVAIRSRPSPLPGYFRTPHDWIVLAYLVYIVFFGDASLMGVLPFLAFYVLTVQSVNTWERLFAYLKFWVFALITVALFGAMTSIGIDVTGAQSNWFTQMGRLALGTFLHNNPNSLGHTIIAALPAAFILYFQRSSILSRLFLFPALAAIVIHCAVLTQSKGTYLVGGALMTIAIILGRPRWFQAIFLAAALVGGVSALSFLPRMSDMNNLSADEGVQGRVLAWEQARTTEKANHTGIGYGQFIASIPWREGNYFLVVRKATHSSYVQVGADLGRYGLFFFLAGLWASLHTLIVFRAQNVVQEKCQRILVILIMGYVLSGWLINRQYHTEYFLLIAAAASLHRLRKAEELQESASGADSASREKGRKSPWQRAKRAWERRRPAAWKLEERAVFSPDLEQRRLKPFWNRFGIADIAVCIGLTWLTFWTWDYLMSSI